MYNKLPKKGIALIAAICCLTVFLSAGFVSAFAAETLSDEMILDLKAFEILQGDENGALNLEQPVTRAELSKVVAVVMQLDGISYPEDYGIIYEDVPSDHWAFPYIVILSGLGLLNGNPDGYFYPDNTVTLSEAAKILVHMLGYGIEAEELGGYPTGYLSSASRHGVTSGISAGPDDGLTREQTMRMIYNCLDADRLVTVYSNNDDVVAEVSSKTYRDLLMGSEDDGLAEIEGVVTANYESYLLDPVPGIEKYQVEIDGVIYDKGETNADEYLGMKVRAFVQRINGSNRGVIRGIEAVKDSSVIDLAVEDVTSITDDTISYYTENSKRTVSKKLLSDTLVLYNGRPLEGNDLTKLDLTAISDGSLKLISHQSGSAINVVFVDVYEDFVVESVNAEAQRLTLANEKKFDNSKIISFDESDTDKIRVLKNAQGEDITLEDVKAGDVLTAYGSQDGTLGKFYVCSDSVTGTVSELKTEEREMRINEEVYSYGSGLDVENILGQTVVVKLNYLGRISALDFDLATAGQYGAIVNLKVEDGLTKELIAQVVLPGKIVDDEEEEGDGPSAQAVPMIEAQNSGVETFTFASKVSFNGVSYSDAVKLEQAIREAMGGKSYLAMSYKLSTDGLIKRMDALEEHTVLQNTKQYNAYSKTFAGAGGAFGLGDTTLALCVPSNSVSSTDDYLARIEMNDDQNYAVSAYEYNEDTRCPDIVVFQSNMVYDTSGIANDGKKIGLIESVISSLNEDGYLQKEVVMATPDEIGTYVISENTASTADFDSLKPGDLILYSLDSKDYLDGFNRLESCDPIPGDYNPTRYNFQVYSGTAVDAEYKVVSNDLNDWVDTITLTGEGLSQTTFEVKRESTPPVYVWDSDRKTVTIGTTEDFLAKQKHAIVVKDTTGSMLVRAVVIII
ncbi:S-layer homology domain-containing protein [Ructibacterium gallinarum]|uniref:S-layer homology domain-containing protein n=1 Tax=Ructibacterium gallinarum TaxID=2779355 RepID=A0A9D5R928_9FIRM|nr:S-layer homology domain-containing protein [Ructibacterium gallinarum]MBE5040044.1 S-layer homology domain-containing protein [Ructibacterium gallinarum]